MIVIVIYVKKMYLKSNTLACNTSGLKSNMYSKIDRLCFVSDKFSSLNSSVSREMENLRAEVKRQEEEHIPKNIKGIKYVVVNQLKGFHDNYTYHYSTIKI